MKLLILSLFAIAYVSCENCSSIKDVKAYLIDLDGTMYLSEGLIEGAQKFYSWIISTNKPFAFVSNSAAKGPLGVQTKFATPPWVLDPPVPQSKVITAAQSLAYYLRDNVPPASRIYFLDSVTKLPTLEDSCTSTIQRTVPESMSTWIWRTDMNSTEIQEWAQLAVKTPGKTFVVNCVDGQVGDIADPVTGKPGYTDWNYALFSQATWLLLNGATLISSAPDLTSPPVYINGALIESPGPGTVHAMLAAVAFPKTANSTIIVGKGGNQGTKSTMLPAVELLRAQGFNGSLSEVAMVGDTLYTDIRGGVAAGMKTIFVLSGVSKPSEQGYFPDAVPTCTLPNVGYIPQYGN